MDINLFSALKDEYDLNDLNEVEVLLEEMYEQGCRPIVSVNALKANNIAKNGLEPKFSWIKEAGPIIVGTFGIRPYNPEGQNRKYFRLNVPLNSIRPRYTGPNSSFAGVVYLGNRKIPPSQLELIDEIGFLGAQDTRTRISSIVNFH